MAGLRRSGLAPGLEAATHLCVLLETCWSFFFHILELFFFHIYAFRAIWICVVVSATTHSSNLLQLPNTCTQWFNAANLLESNSITALCVQSVLYPNYPYRVFRGRPEGLPPPGVRPRQKLSKVVRNMVRGRLRNMMRGRAPKYLRGRLLNI